MIWLIVKLANHYLLTKEYCYPFINWVSNNGCPLARQIKSPDVSQVKITNKFSNGNHSAR